MTTGVVWALVAAVGFGFTQAMNRKSNLLVGATRTAFGLLVAVEAVLLVWSIGSGSLGRLSAAPLGSLAAFATSATIHYAIAWTLLAMSQQRIGVARTGAVISAAPLFASVLAAMFLDEALTVWTGVGVILAVVGVALVAMSRAPKAVTVGTGVTGFTAIDTPMSRVPWFGLAVALCWGVSPMFIRIGLDGIDEPVLGLTFGLGVALLLHGIVLTARGVWARPGWDPAAIGWMAVGGVTGAIGIGASWISFGLTTVAIASTVQQLAALVVVILAKLMFDAAFERINALLLIGTATLLAGSAVVVWAG